MARLLGITQSTYQRYEYGDHAPSPFTMNLYVKEFGISLEWLILGRGPKYFGDIRNALEKVKKLEKENESLKQELDALKGEHQAHNPEGSVVVKEKDMVELFRYTDENPLLKHQLLTYFFQYKSNPQVQDIPAIGNQKQ